MIDARVYVPVLLLMLLLAGCASFPEARPAVRFDDGLSAEQVFAQCLVAHGGDIREHPGDINLSTDGRWYALIQRIQPIVSDAGFRVTSQERYRPRDGLYAVRHEGPLGTKQVVRMPTGISVYYNGERETDPPSQRGNRDREQHPSPREPPRDHREHRDQRAADQRKSAGRGDPDGFPR